MAFADLLHNQTLLAVIVSWLVAQTAKPVVYRFTKRQWDWHWLLSAGGMPSSHSAAVASLAVAVGVREGLQSSAFAITVVVAAVVMYDAAGIRRAASIQARILNQILEELFAGHPIAHERLRELLGHTPFEVLVGAALGAGIGFLVVHRA
jgi:uncharacterized protein